MISIPVADRLTPRVRPAGIRTACRTLLQPYAMREHARW